MRLSVTGRQIKYEMQNRIGGLYAIQSGGHDW